MSARRATTTKKADDQPVTPVEPDAPFTDEEASLAQAQEANERLIAEVNRLTERNILLRAYLNRALANQKPAPKTPQDRRPAAKKAAAKRPAKKAATSG